jgi:hypothetical protein
LPLIIYPLAKAASLAYIAMAIGGVELHQFLIVNLPLEFLGSPREVDMIENLDPITWLSQLEHSYQILFPHPCLKVFVNLRPDVFCASVNCNKEEILEETGIEVVGITLVCIAREGNCIHLLCDVNHGEMTKSNLAIRNVGSVGVWNAGHGRTQKSKK